MKRSLVLPKEPRRVFEKGQPANRFSSLDELAGRKPSGGGGTGLYYPKEFVWKKNLSFEFSIAEINHYGKTSNGEDGKKV